MHDDHDKSACDTPDNRSLVDLIALARECSPLEALFRMPDCERLIDRLTFAKGRGP